ncbi:Ig-like domain-containing protein [Sulfurimonas sp. SAG-AH-194-C21]|nr:PKD domain-containing protein [Sulfurimonas sp. SAG-AH-194-C21]MDF1884195.1 Ig-like domain-containing protein [Sulfurimonas sp. SAG-AH-194-C21]
MKLFLYLLVTILVFSSCGQNINDEGKPLKKSFSITRAFDTSSFSIYKNIRIEFSAEIDKTTLGSETVYILDSNDSKVSGTLSFKDVNSSVVLFSPQVYFNPSSEYTLVVSTDLKDIEARSLGTNYYYSFSTKNDLHVIKAAAGPDQNVTIDSKVTLDASQSRDLREGSVTYLWSIIVRPQDSNATLSDVTLVNPTFIADKEGEYTFGLVVNDGIVSSEIDRVSVLATNNIPVAMAGPNQKVITPAVVVLDGSLSSDADLEKLTYSWSILKKPIGSNATLSDITLVNPTFSADKDGDYTFGLVVNDGRDNSTNDTNITVTSINIAPVANAGPDQIVDTPSTVTLNGLSSSDVNGDVLIYTWSMLSQPDASNATLSSTTSFNPTFLTDKDGDYILGLIVSDGKINSVSSTVTVSSINTAPIANAGPDQIVDTFSTVNLTGLSSSDANGDALTYTWSITSQPSGSATALSNVNSATPTFITEVDGYYTFGLVVNDSKVNSVSDSILVTSTRTLSNFSMTLDVNESTVIADWRVKSGASASATVSVNTQGAYGTVTISGDNVYYLKTQETKSTDSAILNITDYGVTRQVTVTVNALYWKQTSAGYAHTVALKSDGTLWSWGWNVYGTISDGTTVDKSTPTQESSKDTTWSFISAGYNHTMAIKSDGTLWAWGRNNFGQLGDTTLVDKSNPTQVSTGTTWSSVSGGAYHTAAIKSDGTLWTWGRNDYGQLGDNTTTNSTSPVQENSLDNTWSSLAGGAFHTIGIRADGSLWAWGYNPYGQLGDGTTVNKIIPTQEDSNSTNWSSVSGGIYHTAAVKSNGTLWAWGNNLYGQLGDGTGTAKNIPTQEDSNSTNWSSIEAGRYYTVATKSDGTLWGSGYNALSQLGDGTSESKTSYTQESSGATIWSSASGGSNHTVALKNDGTLWTWGQNDHGQLGDGTIDNGKSFIQEVSASTTWSSIETGRAHTVAIKSDGTLWAWGWNLYGQIGDGTITNKSTPTQENSGSTNWSSIATRENHTVAIKSDGTLWAWGQNSNGQLGDGTTVDKSVPTQESSVSSLWTAVAAGLNFTGAIRSDGTLWWWGADVSGGFGANNPTQESSGLTTWSSIAAGENYYATIKTDGTLWSWGSNTYGQLGDGTTTDSSTPVQESSGLGTWSSISAGTFHTVARKSDNTLWAWGRNNYGQLGDATLADKSDPTQENSLSTTWNSASAGNFHTVAIKTDGTMWAWGWNANGQLGDGTYTDRNVPTQESTLSTDGISFKAGRYISVAIRTGGTIWGVGLNVYSVITPLTDTPTKPQPRP